MNSANISLIAQFTRSQFSVNNIIYGEKASSPSSYGASEDFSLRTLTTANDTFTLGVTWNAGTSYALGSAQTIIQELANAYAPYSSGVIAIMCFNNGTGGTDFQSGYTYDTDSSKGASLAVDYTATATDPFKLPLLSQNVTLMRY